MSEDIAIIYQDLKELSERIKKIEQWIQDYDKHQDFLNSEGLGQV